MILERYRGLFVSESEAHLDALSKGVLEIEPKADTAPDQRIAAIHEVFRHLHSLKGMAQTMGFDDFGECCHRLEDAMSEVRDGKREIDRELVEVLLFAVDQLGFFVLAIRDNATPSPLTQLLMRCEQVVTKSSAPLTSEEKPTPIIETGQLALKIYIDERSATPALRAQIAVRRIQEAIGAAASLVPTLEQLKKGDIPLGCVTLYYPTLIDEEKVTTAIAGLSDVARFEVAPVTVQPAIELAAKPRSEARSVRVRTSVLDDLLDAAGELLIAESRVRASVKPARESDAGRSFELLSQAIRSVHSRALALRTVAFSTAAERYPRVVRDAAAATGKQVELQIEGLELELDRAVLEGIDSAIVHLLRNAVDHGVELPLKRGSKSRTGIVTVKAERDRDAIAITVQDDGAGIDERAIRQEAKKRGLILPDATLAPAQILRVLAHPGFSTKGSADHLSGRGVGMDAVVDAADALGGTVDLAYEPGRMTRFTLRLPPSIAVQPVMRVVTGGMPYGVPLRRVASTQQMSEDAVVYRGEELPLQSLARLLGVSARAEENWVVIVEVEGQPMALGVEKILDVRDVVIKKIGPPASMMHIFDSATISSNGLPMMILDVGRLLSQH
jgi:two-component system, chemotaxis family, sensor kinase CheA